MIFYNNIEHDYIPPRRTRGRAGWVEAAGERRV